MRIAILSDTHGLLRPEVEAELQGADHILHAGDVGAEAILERLSKIAPLTAIRGNVDTTVPLSELPATEMVELGGVVFYLLHSILDLDLDPAAAGVHVVVFGHSHKPSQEQRRGVTFLNPGSAGPRRFKLPISMAMATVASRRITIELLTLQEMHGKPVDHL